MEDIKFQSDEELDECIKQLGEILAKEDEAVHAINLPRYTAMEIAYAALEHMFDGTDVFLTSEVHKPYKSMGSITMETHGFLFSNIERFIAITSLANNIEIYPLRSDSVRITLTFHNIAKKVM